MAGKTKIQYRVKTGLDYGKDKRAEKGDVVSDLPVESIAWLLEQGHIEPHQDVQAKETGK